MSSVTTTTTTTHSIELPSKHINQLKVDAAAFMLWENFTYCSKSINLQKCKKIVESNNTNDIITHVSEMRRHFQLQNYPIIIAMFLPSLEAATLLDSLTMKAEHMLSLAYFAHIAYFDHHLITQEMKTIIDDIIDTKKDFVESTVWFDCTKSDDINYVKKTVTTISINGKAIINNLTKNFHGHFSLESIKKNSLFYNKTNQEIYNDLKSKTLQEKLSYLNEALVCGLEREQVEMLLAAAAQEGGSIIPIKIAMCCLENKRFCEIFITSNASKFRNQYFACNTKQDYADILKNCPHYIADILSNFLLEKLSIEKKILDPIIVALDESGSQEASLEGSNLPFSKFIFNAMMLYQLQHTCKDLRIVFTGYRYEIREVIIPNINEFNIIEFISALEEHASFNDGLYAVETLNWIRYNLKPTNKHIIIIMADSGDCGDKSKMYPYALPIMSDNKIFYLNCSIENRVDNPLVKSNEQYALSIEGYSDYWIEPILYTLGINSGMAKNLDKKGTSYRGEF